MPQSQHLGMTAAGISHSRSNTGPCVRARAVSAEAATAACTSHEAASRRSSVSSARLAPPCVGKGAGHESRHRSEGTASVAGSI